MQLALTMNVPGGGASAPFEPAATLALDFTGSRYRAGSGSGSSPNFSTLPGLTVSRASVGYAETSSGTLVQFPTNTARITDKGLLVEEARTNGIRNSTATGAVAGVVGSGGALPTNWSVNTPAVGLTTTVIGSGTAFGIPYVEVRIAGTPTAASYEIVPEGGTQVAALTAQTWTNSIYVSLAGGSTTNIVGIASQVVERNGAGTLLTGFDGPYLTPTSSALVRPTVTKTLNQATTAFVSMKIVFGLTIGLAIDVTLRFYLPQIEQGAFVTSPIPTTAASATRAADAVSFTGLSSTFTAPFTVNISANMMVSASATNVLTDFDDGTTNNRYSLRRAAGASAQAFITAGGVGQTGTDLGAFGAGRMKVAMRARAGTYRLSAGGVLGSETAITSPSGLTRLIVGASTSGTAQANAYIEQLVVRGDTTDAQLTALTA